LQRPTLPPSLSTLSLNNKQQQDLLICRNNNGGVRSTSDSQLPVSRAVNDFNNSQSGNWDLCIFFCVILEKVVWNVELEIDISHLP
jgi:hypothetical protein